MVMKVKWETTGHSQFFLAFQKIVERITYNRVFKYLTAIEILYKKQFGFRKGQSTEHAII